MPDKMSSSCCSSDEQRHSSSLEGANDLCSSRNYLITFPFKVYINLGNCSFFVLSFDFFFFFGQLQLTINLLAFFMLSNKFHKHDSWHLCRIVCHAVVCTAHLQAPPTPQQTPVALASQRICIGVLVCCPACPTDAGDVIFIMRNCRHIKWSPHDDSWQCASDAPASSRCRALPRYASPTTVPSTNWSLAANNGC